MPYAFIRAQGWHIFVVLGAIVLAFTGAEALYADLGHFGKRPIQIAWAGLVLPALALNYMGQGALLMRDPAALENPFFRMFPAAWLIPAVILATVATIIASQAVITGAYSMTKQVMQLGLLPRMHVLYTSAKEMGQIYIPLVNWLLLAAVLLAVLGFGSSSALASAYGIAVTVTMFTTTLLTFFVLRFDWRYPLPLAAAATSVFLALDLLLVIACSLKFFQGGWFPLALGLALFTVMASWRRGRELLLENIGQEDPELLPFLQALTADGVNLARRTAVYAVASPNTVPQALLHNLKHNQVLHERNLILTVVFHDVPWVPAADRIAVEPLDRGLLEGPGQLRLQGHAGHSASACQLQVGGVADQPVRDHLFPQPGDHRSDPAGRHGALARGTVRVHVTERGQHRRLSATAEQLRDRAGNTRSALGESAALLWRFQGRRDGARLRVRIGRAAQRMPGDQDLRHVIAGQHPQLRHRQRQSEFVGGQQGIAEHEEAGADGDGQ